MPHTFRPFASRSWSGLVTGPQFGLTLLRGSEIGIGSLLKSSCLHFTVLWHHAHLPCLHNAHSSQSLQDARQQRLAVSLWIGNTMAVSFQTWQRVAVRRQFHRHVASTIVARWTQRMKASSFHRWKERAAQKRDQRTLLNKALVSKQCRALSLAWNAWMEWCLDHQCASISTFMFVSA
jgi:hypothetical protein